MTEVPLFTEYRIGAVNNVGKWRRPLITNYGSALIAVIAAIAIFSVLAGALLSLTSSSQQQTAMSHLAEKSYYLAESGFRYAQTKFQAAKEGGGSPYEAIEALDGAYTLSDSNSRFNLEIYSYFFILDADTASGQNLTVHAPGSFPSDEITQMSNQKIQIRDQNIQIYTIASVELIDADSLTITLTSPLSTPLKAGSVILPVTQDTASSSQTFTINNGDSIQLPSGQGDMFPLRNGQVRVAGRILTYRLKTMEDGDYFLSDVIDPNDPSMPTFSIGANEIIWLQPYWRVHSTGSFGSGDTLVERDIDFFSSLPFAFSEEYEGMDKLTSALEMGSHVLENVGADTNQVFKVTSVETANQTSLALLDVDGNAAEATEALNDFRRASGGYLSYDAQTKVGFFSGSNFYPDFIQNEDLAAGLSFRINSEVVGDETLFNMYGISFLHRENATSTSPPLEDITPPGLALDEPAIVLWQQVFDTDGTAHRTWLAFKKLSATLYSQNFNAIETGMGDWTNEGTDLWRIENNALVIDEYDPGIAQSPIISIPGDGQNSHSKVTISFQSSIEFIYPFDVSPFARREVRIVEDGTSETIPVTSRQLIGGGYRVTAEIPTKYIGKDIMIQFFFDRGSGNGWSVDDVAIVSESPIHNSTLLVRLTEAAVIPFIYTDTAIIRTGDRVFGGDSDAWGRVIVPPLLTSENQGHLLLNSVSEGRLFAANEDLNIFGKGTIAQINGESDVLNYRKINVIKIYFASKDGCTGSVPDPSTPLDCFTLAYARQGTGETLQWPVQDGIEWTANKDYFRLIQWDGVNESDGSNLNIGLIGTLIDTYDGSATDHTVIISHNDKLQSLDINATIPELGLHTLGANAANHVYFDDFGFRLYYLSSILFPTAFQQ